MRYPSYIQSVVLQIVCNSMYIQKKSCSYKPKTPKFNCSWLMSHAYVMYLSSINTAVVYRFPIPSPSRTSPSNTCHLSSGSLGTVWHRTPCTCGNTGNHRATLPCQKSTFLQPNSAKQGKNWIILEA